MGSKERAKEKSPLTVTGCGLNRTFGYYLSIYGRRSENFSAVVHLIMRRTWPASAVIQRNKKARSAFGYGQSPRRHQGGDI